MMDDTNVATEVVEAARGPWRWGVCLEYSRNYGHRVTDDEENVSIAIQDMIRRPPLHRGRSTWRSPFHFRKEARWGAMRVTRGTASVVQCCICVRPWWPLPSVAVQLRGPNLAGGVLD